MTNEVNDIPVIKTFIHNRKCFVYDTYTNQLLNITKEQFLEINELKKLGVTKYKKLNKSCKAYNDILMLLRKGYFKTSFIEDVVHPDTKYVKYILERGINDITFQVTRECNFKCRYCMYATNNSLERGHEKVNMSWEVAKKSLDYLIAHSQDAEILTLAFYGGEPLLNFNLIQKIVEYVEQKIVTKKIKYNMTINASVLPEQIMEFLVEHNVLLTISLDGPKEIQNRHRKFLKTGSPTYDVVLSNIIRLKNKYPVYFNTYVDFLPVGFSDEKYEDIIEFFKTFDISENKILYIPAGMDGIDYINSNTSNDDSFATNENQFLDSTKNLGIKTIALLNEIYANKTKMPEKWHHNGPCIPGFKRLFVDVYGAFYPCEKVLERNEFRIGDISSGIDYNKVIELLNIGKLTESGCKSCWAARFCSICIAYCNDVEKNALTYEQKHLECRRQESKALLFFKHYIDNNKIFVAE